MPNLTNSSFLKNVQYRDSSKLSARASLHYKYSTSKISWHNWVFQQLELPPRTRILEIGCGPAYLWQTNLADLPPDWLVFLTDLSRGMLEEARTVLPEKSKFSYTLLDAAHLPFPAEHFDAVIANHVLYHLPELEPALREIHRVLKSSGCLYAATNGEQHLSEIRAWKAAFLSIDPQNPWGTSVDKFNLNNGADQLSQHFQHFKLLSYQDELEITAVEPILQYIESYLDPNTSSRSLGELKTYLSDKLAKDGLIRVSKETGMFQAFKR